jgi:hypothetical protein
VLARDRPAFRQYSTDTTNLRQYLERLAIHQPQKFDVIRRQFTIHRLPQTLLTNIVSIPQFGINFIARNIIHKAQFTAKKRRVAKVKP